MNDEQAQPRRTAWSAIALSAVLLVVEAVIVAESWRGLTGFAHLIGITGPAAWGVPVTLDGVSLVAALVALRAELSGEASGLYRVVLFVFTGASAAANYWHGRTTGGEEAALYLGGMSVAVAVVFALALRQIRREDRRRAGTVTGRLPRFSVAHWARYPGLTWRAWSLAVRDGHTSPRVALDAALGVPGSHPTDAPWDAVETHVPDAPTVAAQTHLANAVETRHPDAVGTQPRAAIETHPADAPETHPADALETHPADAAGRASRAHQPNAPRRRGRKPATDAAAETHFAAFLADGQVPSVRQIERELHVGRSRAQAIRQHLARQAFT